MCAKGFEFHSDGVYPITKDRTGEGGGRCGSTTIENVVTREVLVTDVWVVPTYDDIEDPVTVVALDSAVDSNFVEAGVMVCWEKSMSKCRPIPRRDDDWIAMDVDFPLERIKRTVDIFPQLCDLPTMTGSAQVPLDRIDCYEESGSHAP